MTRGGTHAATRSGWICLSVAALFSTIGCVTSSPLNAPGGRPRPGSVPTRTSVLAQMEMLSSDALQGRASGSRDSRVAATYIASELRRIGVEPAGDDGGYFQPFIMRSRGPSAATASGDPPRRAWNVIGRLQGSDRGPGQTAILLTAHLDHIGVSGTGDDQINNGADDNASGVTAVLQLAEAFAGRPRTRRTILFVLFDAEEPGGQGSEQFLNHPPVPLSSIAAQINFEMIGRPDPAVGPGTLWLTGHDRSTLGTELARLGARVVADPHPTLRFFERSDNVAFAERGVVAHTLASYGLHREYHTPDDELDRIDIDHMVTVIRMIAGPIRTFANSSWVPRWLPGRQPTTAAGQTGR